MVVFHEATGIQEGLRNAVLKKDKTDFFISSFIRGFNGQICFLNL
jgi:hypothetical protein